VKLIRPAPLGNGPIVKLEGFTTMDVWVVESYASIGLFNTFRTMTIIRNRKSKDLTLINSSRLDLETEKQLLQLGRIAFVCRISTHSSHSQDDYYYVENFQAKPYSFLSAEKKKTWPRNVAWEIFTPQSPPSCFEFVEVLEVPMKEGAECVLFFPQEKCIITSDLMQNNDLDHTKVFGMSLSDLKIPKVSQVYLTLQGLNGGHLQTPKKYWNICGSEKDMYAFHGDLMDRDWDRVITSHGGPSLYSAKRIRRDHIQDWPAVAFGKKVQLCLI
jgi:hypothetical protein